MIMRIVSCLVLAGASFAFADSRVVSFRGTSLDALTATLSQGHGGDALIGVAQERQARMSQLVVIDPAAVLRVALSDGDRAALSPRVRAFIEERVEIEGTLQVLVEDREDGSRRLTFLETDSGERYALYFASQPTRLVSGARVKIAGLRIDQAIAIESGVNDVKRISGVSTESVEATEVMGNTFGAQRTAVLLVNFSNNPVQPYSVATAQSVVFTSTSNFNLENSYGQTWLTGDVLGWYTIAQTSTTSCDYMTLANQAKAKATAAGVNLSNYTRHVFAFPNNACGWWGLGTVGGFPSMAWINGSLELRVVGHEMGHNLGLDHSHSLDCGTAVLGTTCTMSEYGDTLDIMGSAAYHFNSYSKELLGWLNYGSSPAMTTVTSSGTYTINPYQTLGSASKALKIRRGTTSSYFYVELRRGLGFDAALASNANVSNGVVVHMASPSDTNTSNLLDMTAGTASWSDPALVVGQTFTDSTSGVSITVNSVSGTGASVTVALNGTPPPTPTPSPTPTPTPPPTCTHVAPLVSLSPSTSAGVAAGTAVNFTVSVTNRDVSPCTASSFTLTSTVPSGWTGALTAASLSAAPGASASTTLRVTSAGSAAGGSYPVSATARNSVATTATATASANYIVNTPTGGSTGTISDNFNRADSTALGSAWTEITGNLLLSGNVLKNTAGVTGNSMAVVSTLSGPTESAEADFTSTDNNLGPRFGIILRYQDSLNYYQVYRQTGGSSRLLISRFVNGVEKILGTSNLANPVKNVAFHLKGRVTGATISLDFGGVNKVNVTDTTFATGKVGVLIGSSGSFQQKADNFTATVQ